MRKNSKIIPGLCPIRIILLTALISITCSSGKNDIFVLQQYTHDTYSDMLKELGSPVDKTGYTIRNAPTKSWNHHELFSKYPKIPKNDNIQIMEVIWDAGDSIIIACFHMVDRENRCLVAKKMKKNIQF